jgi:hypothetical protein
VDVQLYLRVLWRFKLLVGAGVCLAIALAVMSVVRVDPGGRGPLLTYREDEQWVSYSVLFVTQQGFPWGQLTQGKIDVQGQAKQDETLAADPNRFSTLAVLYANLATSDPVRAIMKRNRVPLGEIDAAPVLAGDNAFAGALPLIRIAAISDSPQHALGLVVGTTDAFRAFLAREQERNAIPVDNRVRLTIIKRADRPALLAGRSMTLPVIVFLAVMILVSAFAFILENMRPRLRPVASAEAEPSAETERRTA